MDFCERECKLWARSRLNSVHLILSTATAKELYACSVGKYLCVVTVAQKHGLVFGHMLMN